MCLCINVLIPVTLNAAMLKWFGWRRRYTQKRKGRQIDSFDVHWRRWSLSSTSPVNIKAVNLTTFSFQCIWNAFVIGWGLSHRKQTLMSLPTRGLAQHAMDMIAVGNSLRLGDTYMRLWNMSVLVQIMACRLNGTKPLSKPMLSYYRLDPENNFPSFFFYQNGKVFMTQLHLK